MPYHLTLQFSKWRVKLILAAAALGFIASVIYYTQYLADQIINREKSIVEFFADLVQQYGNSNNSTFGSDISDDAFSDDTGMDFSYYLDKILPAITFPMIITDAEGQPIPDSYDMIDDTTYYDYIRNIDIDKTMNGVQQKEYLLGLIEDMGNKYSPLEIVIQPENFVLNKVYFTHSDLVDQLRNFPIIAIIVVVLFILIGYFAFSSFRNNEETKVWVGMSKEAAHQLGTPLSSILAWIEILRLNKNEPNYIEDTLTEIEKDIGRLNKIATRFSKIGSEPEISRIDIVEILKKVIDYIEKRLPHLARKVDIKHNLPGHPVYVNINIELFEWVIENLLKNAAESIDTMEGIVEIYLLEKDKLIINIKDNGKGMTQATKRQIFYPGFTTKKRGWGLGLSLTKRIIEEYHKGKIYVKDSSPGKGTTFTIELPKINS